ncbi:MAG: YwiC-like family protein [Acidobacteria bacterium]|nr:YwiC-like family protein [Acidobacteriota bacterium]
MNPSREPIDFRNLWRSLVPAETGGWFISLFPMIGGLAARPSWEGAALEGMGFLAFLLRVPIRQWHAGVRRRVSRWLVFSGVLGILLLAAVLLRRGGPATLIPPLLALPFGLVALAADLRRRSRNLLVELCALAFFCVFGGGAVWTGGGGGPSALRIGLLAFLTLAPGFAAVRFHLQAHRDIPGPASGPRKLEMHLVMGACLGVGVWMWHRGLAGPAWLALQVLLYPRALLPLRKGPPWRIGVLEILAEAAGLTLAVLHL